LSGQDVKEREHLYDHQKQWTSMSRSSGGNEEVLLSMMSKGLMTLSIDGRLLFFLREEEQISVI
jgi:hypothetical protein